MINRKLSIIASILLLAFPSLGLDGILLDNSGNWSDSSRWSGGTIADGADFTAYFTNNITAARSITNDVPRTIGNITFTDATTSHNLTIARGSTLTLERTSGTPNVNVTQSGRTLTMACVIGGTNGLAKTGSGLLDLTGTNTFTGGLSISGSGNIQFTFDHNLGDVSSGITFNGTGTLSYLDNLVLNAGRTFTINGTATLGANITVPGFLTGNGILAPNSADGFYFSNPTNDFSGTINAATGGQVGYGLDMASIGDQVGCGRINLNSGTFRWIKASGGPTVFTNRQFALSGTTGPGLISARGVSINETLTILNDLAITGTGNKTLNLVGNNTGNNTFAGSITNGVGSTITVQKQELGTWVLSGTNTYSGLTILQNGSGILTCNGKQSISPNTSFQLNQLSSATCHLKILVDDAGDVVLGNTINFRNQNAISGMQITIGNQNTANGGTTSGTTTGSKLIFGDATFTAQNTALSGLGSINSLNGYKAQFANVIFSATPSVTTWTPSLGTGNATIEITGVIRQTTGQTTAGRRIVYLLEGASTANAISGYFSDALDYPANTNTAPLSVTKQGSGTWTLSGFNTHTGTNTITAGTLALAHNRTLPVKAVINVTSPGVLRLDYSGIMRVASFRIAGVTQPNGIWGSLSSTAPNKTARITGSGLITTSDQVNPNDPSAPIDKATVPSEITTITDFNRLHY